MTAERTAERRAVSAAHLYQLLVRDFHAAQDPGCKTCQVPLPIYRAPADETAANWHTGALAPCPYRCHLVIGEIQARLWNGYDLLVEDAARD